MDTYTITIAPEDGDGSQTTVRVDLGSGEARITEITVRSPAGTGIAENPLEGVDLELLARALRPTEVRAGGNVEPARPAEPAVPAVPAVPRRKSADTATRRVKAESSPRRAPAEATRRRKAPAPAPAPAVTDARVYRKVPDDVVESFERIGSVTALAAHYGVPRHTAQGWINRLRQQTA